MKKWLVPTLKVLLILAVGFGLGSIFHPIIFPADSIPIIMDESSEDLISALVYERMILYTIVEQQDLMIEAYKMMLHGYDSALGALMEIYE